MKYPVLYFVVELAYCIEQKADGARIHPKSLYVLRPLPGLGDENSVS